MRMGATLRDLIRMWSLTRMLRQDQGTLGFLDVDAVSEIQLKLERTIKDCKHILTNQPHRHRHRHVLTVLNARYASHHRQYMKRTTELILFMDKMKSFHNTSKHTVDHITREWHTLQSRYSIPFQLGTHESQHVKILALKDWSTRNWRTSINIDRYLPTIRNNILCGILIQFDELQRKTRGMLDTYAKDMPACVLADIVNRLRMCIEFCEDMETPPHRVSALEELYIHYLKCEKALLTTTLATRWF